MSLGHAKVPFDALAHFIGMLTLPCMLISSLRIAGNSWGTAHGVRSFRPVAQTALVTGDPVSSSTLRPAQGHRTAHHHSVPPK
jgi:hypothetical protein